MKQSQQPEDGQPRHAGFPIVAIGASAGGLEALRQLFSRLPADTGMAFVVIQHLDPDHSSMLTDVLSGETAMPVVEITHRMPLQPDRVHVIPPGADLGLDDGLLTLVPRSQARTLHLPIDAFFRALATDAPARAIGVVLSGSASDGTEGLRAIKGADGIAIAQAPESAQFRSMPESAIAAGVVDFQAAPEEIADELVRLGHHPYLVAEATEEGELGPDGASGLEKAVAAVRRHTGLDFRGYKRATLERRIGRRMALRRVRSVGGYAESLREDPVEAKALAQDFLIHVTSFFRDEAVFEALSRHVLPALLQAKADDDALRVWIPGCSTGEEVYSLAICIVELLAEQDRSIPVKIFGSDLGERAIESARAGLYGEPEMEGVSPERRSRFFERSGGRYRIGKQVRDLCVFVQHDLTRDPPFAKLDLISCRNVLIYFDAELQRRILPLLHHCLNNPGYLVLGSSEDIRGFDDLFAHTDRKHRIFLKTGESPRLAYPLALGREAESRLPALQSASRPRPAREAQRQADHVLLSRFAPPGVVIDERLQVVQFRGRTGEYLSAPPGQPQTQLLKMAREGLAGPLREAIEAAKAQSATVRRHGVLIKDGAPVRQVNLEVVPLTATAGARYFLVVFETPAAREQPSESPPPVPASGRPSDDEPARLRSELEATRDYLQSLTGEHEDATEELGAANEELIASNEELQSTNEELQSAKEELQSTNEELSTLNDELNHRNADLDRVASDLVNVLESVQIPVIMVDGALRVRRFTPTAREISSLMPEDVGRSIDDVKLKVEVDDLVGRIRETIESLTPREYELQGPGGRWYRLHIRPYRTADGRLDGAVLAFLDVDVLRRALQDAERARDYAQGIVETVPLALVVLDRRLRIVSTNPPFDRGFGAGADLGGAKLGGAGLGGAGLLEIADGALDVAPLREALEHSLSYEAPITKLEVQCTLPVDGERVLVFTGRPLEGDRGDPLLLLAIEDITGRRQLEASEKESRLDAEKANRAKDIFLATLSHELRTPLSTILMSSQLLQMQPLEDPRIQRASAAIERAAQSQARLIDDLLDISRIVSGKLMLDLEPVELPAIVQNAVDVASGPAEAKGIALEVSILDPGRSVQGDPVRLQQVVANLLNNAVKFTPQGGTISVGLDATGDQARIVVADTGAGLRDDMLPRIFDRFVQAEGAMTRVHGGLGLGLAIVRHIVEVHGGEVRAESEGEGHGTTFTVTLPLAEQDVPAAATARRTVARSIGGIRVLLIEDDDDTREATAAMLEEQGAEVRTAPSSETGLTEVQSFRPQVILCDVAMSGEDGYAFVRRLRSGTHGSHVPAAALTALAGVEDRRRALEAGFQMHLAKPIDADRLAVAVSTLAAAGPVDGSSLEDAPPRADGSSRNGGAG